MRGPAELIRDPRLRPLAAALHGSAVAAEIGAERAADRLRPRPRPRTPLLDELTLVVKTFERPRIARRLLASVRRLYPDLRVVLVDDSRVPLRLDGVELVTLPHRSGVSAGRSAGLERVRTRFVGVLDDDFVFTRRTDLPSALETLARNEPIDILAGRVVNLPRYRVHDYRRAPLFPGAAPGVLAPGTLIDGLPVLAKVPNFYVARAERLRLVDWDPEVRRVEHADFFSRASGILVSVLDERLRVLHARTPFDRTFTREALGYQEDAALLAARWSRVRPAARE